MLTAKQALKIAKPQLEAEQAHKLEQDKALREVQLKGILAMIRKEAERNKTALSLDYLPIVEVEGELATLGYKIVYMLYPSLSCACLIEWGDPAPEGSVSGFIIWLNNLKNRKNK